MSIENKVAIVTGGGKGMGASICRKLASRGAKIAVVDFADDRKKIVDEIKSKGGKAIDIAADVTVPEQVQDAIRKTIDTFGTVNILVNNAGIYPFHPIEEITIDDWHKVINVNLNSAFYFVHAALPELRKNKHSRIVNICSIGGSVIGFGPGLIHYSASKAGVMGFTRSLALAVAPYGITANAISPGVIGTDTAMELFADKTAFEMLLAAMPLKRMGRPEEVADLVAFLVSESSGYITGANMVIDGAYTQQ